MAFARCLDLARRPARACLDVGYRRVSVLRNVSLSIAKGSIVAVLGGNGAGKSTLLRSISGLLRPTTGRIVFDGADIAGQPPHAIVRAGLLHVSEGHRLFNRQSVMDNLELGLFGEAMSASREKERFDHVFDLFPVLREFRGNPAGSLSGGQQQMLAIGCALMRQPKFLMLDEPLLGLAPIIIDQVFDVILKLRRSGTTVLLVEQMVERALSIADHAFVLQNGELAAEGTPSEIRDGDLISKAYLGAGATAGQAQRATEHRV